MKARAAVVAAALALPLAGVCWLGQRWQSQRERLAAADQKANAALIAELERVSRKVERLELAILAARADALAACARPAPRADEPAAHARGAEAPLAAAPAEALPEDSPHFSDAKREVDDAIRRGSWSATDGQRFETLVSSLDGERRHQALARLTQAANASRLAVESGAFPF
jgi:hypothetical protein